MMKNKNLTINTLSQFSKKDLDDFLNQYSIPFRNHSRRVAFCATTMAEYAKDYIRTYSLPRDMSFLITVRLGGLYHDIGKLAIPSLTMDESSLFKHPITGADLLEMHSQTLFDSQLQADIVLEMVRYHHERPDGTGFPYGLWANDIPFAAGLCAIADWVDNRICSESQKENGETIATTFEKVIDESGEQFCESAVTCFTKAKNRLRDQYIKWCY